MACIWMFLSLFHTYIPHIMTCGGSFTCRAFLAELLTVARKCYEPSSMPTQRDPRVQHQRRDARVMLPPGIPLPPNVRDPRVWSLEESFLRTGTWCCVGLQGGQAFEPSELGGLHVKRALRTYANDHPKHAHASGEDTCTKHKESKPSLVPGTVLGWCHDCGKCLFFSVMANVESPRTVFEILYTHFATPPRRVIYDNACNLMHFTLNREPAHFKETAFIVDRMHFTEHTKCCEDFDSSKYACIRNSPLAEQRNSVLRHLEKSVSFMTQATALTFMRHCLHRMHSYKGVQK